MRTSWTHCQWSPFPVVCSCGRARSAARASFHADPPYSCEPASLAVSRSHSGFHFQLQRNVRHVLAPWKDVDAKSHESWKFTDAHAQIKRPFLVLSSDIWADRNESNRHDTKSPQVCETEASIKTFPFSPCTVPHGYWRAFTILLPTFTSSILPTTAKGRWPCEHKLQITQNFSAGVQSANWKNFLFSRIFCFFVFFFCFLSFRWETYIHSGIDVCHSFIVCWELINMHTVAHQFTHHLRNSQRLQSINRAWRTYSAKQVSRSSIRLTD